jgi:MFS family permease
LHWETHEARRMDRDRAVVRVRELPLWKPFQTRPFRLLWAGTGLSMLADQAFLVALTWLVLQVAGPGAGLGAVLAVASVPGTVLTPLGGVMSDRLSPARVMIFASAGRVLLLATLAALILADATRLWHVYLLAGGLSALDALYYPASMAIVPSLVDRERLGAANALAQGVEQISSILGPALAGAMISLLGLGATFGANALLFLVATAIFASVARATNRRPGAGRAEASDAGDDRRTGAVTDLLEGARYAWGDPVIRSLLLILAGINVAMVGPLYVGGATLAETRLGGPGAFAALVAFAGAGSLAGAAVAGSAGSLRRRGLLVLAITVLLGVIVGSVAFVPNLPVAAGLAFGIGGAAGFLGVVNISWLQERSEPELTGRVMSLAMFAAVSLDPLSFALAGLLAELGLAVLFLTAGGLLLVTALFGSASVAVRAAD